MRLGPGRVLGTGLGRAVEDTPRGLEGHTKGFEICPKGSGQLLEDVKQAVNFLSPRLLSPEAE